MSRRNLLVILTVLAPLLVLVYGISNLFKMRLDKGDIYPPYSSLRTDPLGTKMLYESLRALDGVSIKRNFNLLTGHPLSDRATLIIAGVPRTDIDEAPSSLFDNLNQFVIQGGRLVLTFFPEPTVPRARRQRKERNNDQAPDETGSNEEPAPDDSDAQRNNEQGKDADHEDTSPVKTAHIRDAWGVEFAHAAFPKEATPRPLDGPDDEDTPPDLGSNPGEVRWNTTLYFQPTGRSWKTIYARGPHPVVIERTMGKGEIVLVSDSFFLSNQALAQHPSSGLLRFVLGAHRQFVFDESHFDIVKQPGVMSLALKYRLHGLLTGLAALALLTLWRSMYSLVPRASDYGNRISAHVGGKDAAAGFVNLLRRNIPPSRLIETCLNEWEQTVNPGQPIPGGRLSRARALLERSGEKHVSPAKLYSSIQRIINEREQRHEK